MVTNRNNVIPLLFEDSGVTSFVSIEEGNYTTGTDFANAVNRALMKVSYIEGLEDVSFRVNYGLISEKMEIYCSHPIKLVFYNNTFTSAKLMGFPENVTASAVNSLFMDYPQFPYIVSAPHRVNLWANKRFMSLHIWQPVSDAVVSATSSLDTSFSVIAIPRSCNVNDSLITMTNSDLNGATKIWDPPLSSIGKIGLSFKDDAGFPVEFHNQDHVLEFILETLPNSVTRRYV
jgi:hypothetical protein